MYNCKNPIVCILLLTIGILLFIISRSNNSRIVPTTNKFLLRRLSLISDPQSTQSKSKLLHKPVCTHEAINKLTSIISSNVIHESLRPQHVLGINGEITFNGLDTQLVQRSFIGKHIAIIGDSTLMRFYIHLYAVIKLMIIEEDTYVMNLSNMNLKNKRFESLTRAMKNELKVWGNMNSNVAKLHDVNDTQIMFARMHEGRELQNEEFKNNIVNFQPDIVLANIGLHLLHFENHGEFARDNAVFPWLLYEESLEEIIHTAKEAGAKILLLKTTNFVCDDAYIDEWAIGNKLYLANDSDTLERCFTSFSSQRQDFPDTITLSDKDIRTYCRNGVINERGAQMLNMRLYRFIEDAQHRHGSEINIQVYNDRDLQSCATTSVSDGRHHHTITLPRIRLLANQLDCLQNSTTAGGVEY